MVQLGMNKADAIQMLGGSTASAAKAIGISYQAVDKWPDDLPRRIEDRVIAAALRLDPARFKRLLKESLGATQ